MKRVLLRTHRAIIVALSIFICLPATAQESGVNETMKLAVAMYTSQQYDAAIDYCNQELATNPRNAYAYNVRGTCYNKQGKYTNAISDFTQAISLSPGYANALYNRATAYAAQNNYRLALDDYNTSILYEPNKYTYYDRGLLRYNNKEYDNAVKDFTFTIALDERNSNAYLYRGICNYMLKHYQEAVDDYSMLITLSPEYALGYYNRGLAYYAKGDKPKAIADFTSTINLDRTHANAYLQRGKLYAEEKNISNALADYNTVLQLNPKNADVYLQRGVIYHTEKEYTKAVSDYTTYIQLSAAPTYGYHNIGLIKYEKREYDSAIIYFSKVLSIDPSFFDAYVSRGQAYAAKKSYQNAVSDYTSAIQRDPKNVNAYVNRGYAYSSMENFPMAHADYDLAGSIDPTNAIVPVNRGYTYLDQGEYDKAISELNKAINLAPTNREAYIGRGIVNYFASNWNAAIADFDEAIKLDPKYFFARYTRGSAKMFLGKYQDAITDLEQCVAYDSDFASGYLNLFTAYLHTGDMNKAIEYHGAFKRKNLKYDAGSKNWEFYEHYANAMIDGVLTNQYEKALQELSIAENKFSANTSTGNKKNETRIGMVDILFLKGYVLEKLGKMEDAKSAYEQSLAINPHQTDLTVAITRLEGKSSIARSSDKTPPSIVILSPETTRSFDIVSDVSDTKVIGKAVDENGIQSILINGQPVAKVEEGGFFIQQVSLQEGQNVLKVEATDNNGNKAVQSFTLNLKSADQVKTQPEPAKATIGTPLKYHAILIAEQEYLDPSIPDLTNPVSDATELKRILQTHYTFDEENVLLLANKSREDILQALIQKCNTLTPDDNLLIFYAGHGTAIVDSSEDKDVEGYFVPVSAKWKNEVTFISASDIKAALRRSKAKHILLIADACYSGAFTRGLPMDATVDIQKQYKLQSRKVMASGNLEPVPDKSEFIRYLKKRLSDNEQAYLPADELFNNFRKAVLVNSSTTPLYAPIQDTRDEGGDFVFIKKK